MKTLFYPLALLIILFGCDTNGVLRGKELKSFDGLTYLVVENNNGGECGPILVDGSPWLSKIGGA